MLDAAHVLALASAACFGLGLVLMQRGLAFLPPLRGSAISVPLAFLVMVVVAPFTVDWPDLDLTAIGIFAAIGILFPSVVVLLTYQSNFRIGPYLTASLGNLAPLFAVLFAILVFGEWPSWPQAIAIATIVAGATAMVSGANGRARDWRLSALLLPLTAAMIRGLVQPTVKIGLEYWPDPFAALLFCYLVSTAVLLAANAIRWREPFALTREGLAWFSGVGIANGAAVLLMYGALNRGSVMEVAPLVAAFPLATLAFGWFFATTRRADARTAFGVALAVAGVVLLIVY
ncbi:DMT family transporter [Breoghania sp. L-A4]|uniref:DMT family transporter n=1 Tax=Breoghania sp. L-A4 TaxID=2304600 RepID=UPI000E358475|nr:DMT family transporter [Breoghania sp. L-A4]AXS38883.1 DMT family transporter [Breoghania sp. L-A4]